jgi:hypothetical protein
VTKVRGPKGDKPGLFAVRIMSAREDDWQNVAPIIITIAGSAFDVVRNTPATTLSKNERREVHNAKHT